MEDKLSHSFFHFVLFFAERLYKRFEHSCKKSLSALNKYFNLTLFTHLNDCVVFKTSLCLIGSAQDLDSRSFFVALTWRKSLFRVKPSQHRNPELGSEINQPIGKKSTTWRSGMMQKAVGERAPPSRLSKAGFLYIYQDYWWKKKQTFSQC